MGKKKVTKKGTAKAKPKLKKPEIVKAIDQPVPTSGLMNSQLEDAKRLQETLPILANILQEHLMEEVKKALPGTELIKVMQSMKCDCGAYGYHPSYRVCTAGNPELNFNHVQYFYCSQCKKQITPEEVKTWADSLGVVVE